MNSFPYIAFMEILKQGREKMLEETMRGSSITLYDALYSRKDSEVFELKMELYELEWIEFHWQLVSEKINQKVFSVSERKELLSIFAYWLKDLFDTENTVTLDVLIIEEKMNIIKAMISINNEWDKNIKKMKVSFEKSRRQLETKIKKMEMENDYGN